MKNFPSLFSNLIVISFCLISLKSEAQANKYKFKDGTKLKLEITEDHPARGFKHYTYLGFLIEYRDDFNAFLLLNSGYQFNDRLLGQARINIVPGTFANTQYSIGGYYNLSSSIRLKDMKVPLKHTETYSTRTQYYVKTAVQRYRNWQLYGGYSYIGHTIDYNSLPYAIYTGAESYTYFRPYEGFMGTHMIDLGIALQSQRDFIYEVDKDPYNYLSRFRTCFKVHLPISRHYSMTYEYQLNSGSGYAEAESTDISIPDSYLRQIGFSLEMEMLSGGGSLSSKFVDNSNFSIGYFPLLNDAGALIIRITTGYGFGQKGKAKAKPKLGIK